MYQPDSVPSQISFFRWVVVRHPRWGDNLVVRGYGPHRSRHHRHSSAPFAVIGALCAVSITKSRVYST